MLNHIYKKKKASTILMLLFVQPGNVTQDNFSEVVNTEGDFLEGLQEQLWKNVHKSPSLSGVTTFI